MSLIITVWVNDGIVMASDSRITFSNQQIQPSQQVAGPNNALIPIQSINITNITGHYFDSANKTFLCPNNCGVSTCGISHINDLSIESHFKRCVATKITKSTSLDDTVTTIADYFKSLVSQEHILIFYIAGYSTNNDGVSVQKIVKIQISNNKADISPLNNTTNVVGAGWAGEAGIFTKLYQEQYYCVQPIEASNISITQGAQISNISQAYILDKECTFVSPRLDILFPKMSIQEAADFARFVIKTTIDTMKFTNGAKTVGGEIDILVITPDETRWLNKKEIH